MKVKPSGKPPLYCVFDHEVTRAFYTINKKIVCGDCMEAILAHLGLLETA